MFKWTFLLIVIMFSYTVIAQESLLLVPKPVVCGNQKDIFDAIENAGELDIELIGIFTSNDVDAVQSAFTISRNEINETFSIIETSTTGMSCIIGSGAFTGGIKKEPIL
tara:strand:+ start:6303 stop:6629 length:327 start_codon:yes stop_codon:yes gene_type:complete